MAAASVYSVQGAGAGLWAQVQQQQAQRNADQAEQKARALQGQARAAQSEADRAEERARGLQVEASQAQTTAGEARRNVVALDSVGVIRSGLENMRSQISDALATLSSGDAGGTSRPVVNADGQTTGTVINVAA